MPSETVQLRLLLGTATSSMTIELIGVIVYIVLQMAIGAYFLNKNKTEQNYFIGGRQLNMPLAAFSIFATWFGAEVCLSSSAKVYQFGLSGSTTEPFGYTLCLLVMALFFAKKLWDQKLMTLGDLVRNRFSPATEKLAALIMIPTSLFWAAAQIRAFGQVLSASSELSIQSGMIVATMLVIFYTVVGGFLADVYTDFVQSLFLIIGLISLLVFVIIHTGGIENAILSIEYKNLQIIPHRLGGLDEWLASLETLAIPVLGSLVAQELVSRVIASRNRVVAQRATLIAAAGYLIVGLIPVMVALIARQHIVNVSDPEQLLPTLAKSYLPTFMYVVFVGALISAILSTVDSCLLAISSLLTHNLLAPILRDRSESARVSTARLGVGLAGIAAFFVAFESKGIFALIESASSFGSAGILVIMVFALYTKIGRPTSALATLIVGVSCSIILPRIDSSAPFVLSLLLSSVTFLGVEAILSCRRIFIEALRPTKTYEKKLS